MHYNLTRTLPKSFQKSSVSSRFWPSNALCSALECEGQFKQDCHPTRFATATTAGEFIELMHALDSKVTEETPLHIELGDDNRLSLPRKPKKRQVSSFPAVFWGVCPLPHFSPTFEVYRPTICIHVYT